MNLRQSNINFEKLRANKRGKINDSLFNFLENLIIFRTMGELSVPSEGGVMFRISREESDPGICLLIHIDDQMFPIIEEGVPRPDYLAVYIHGDGCLCTIIEMKGRNEKKLEHGLKQIERLADRLKKEFSEHLPPQFRLYIQGILLCPVNSQIPNYLIKQFSEKGLTIYPAQCNTRAELFPYISQKNDLKNYFQNKPRRPCRPGLIEKTISQNALRKRILDDLVARRGGDGLGKGLYINFALTNNEYATLITRDKKCVFVVNEHGDKYFTELQAEINANGLGNKFDVESMHQRNEIVQ